MTLPHAIRRETLDVTVDSQTLAFRLQPRMADLHRSRIVPAIARLLDQLQLPADRIRLDRFDLDLGEFELTDLEARVEERLTRELRRALEELFGRMTHGSVEGARMLSESTARRELLEHYLLHGTLPFWATGAPTFSCESLVLELAESDPVALVALVRRHGRSDVVLERLVTQLDEPALHELIRLLEPRHAALILEYVADVQEVHRVDPVLPLGDRELAHVVWLVVASYLVQDPGSQFNRKSFVKSMLEGLAASEGIVYAEILAALQVGLEWTASRQPLRSSLPAVVAELVRELGDAPAPVIDAEAERLRPRDVAELDRLMELFKRIPAPYRPRPEDRLRRVIVEALLAVDGGAPVGESFYTELLAELFAWPLAEPVARFLLAVTAGPEPDALRAAVLAVPRIDEQIASLPPPAAAELARLMDIFNRIPAPYRPRPEDRLRRVIVMALLAVGAGEEPGEEFYAGLLAELFAWPLAEPVSRFLLEATEGLDALHAAVVLASRAEDARHDERELRRRAADRRTRDKWAEAMGEEELAEIAAVLAPRRHRELLAAANVLTAAWRDIAPPAHPALTERRAFWSFMLGFLARERHASVHRLVGAFFEHSAARYLAATPSAPQPAAERARLLARADRLARASGQTALLHIFKRDRRVLLAPWARVRTTRPRRRVKPVRESEAPADETNPIYIDNAGLVLAAPFLGRLFGMLELIVEENDRKPAMRDAAAASRAVHLLQFLADGRTNAPEPLLVLNKILCGVPTGVPIEREIEPTEKEREICETLLRSILASWTSIANTSVEGLQETFLRREGKLLRIDDGWRLEVQRKTVDFLVDAVPWNVSVISSRWMRETLYIDW